MDTSSTTTEIQLPEPAAHMYPSDLERFEASETFAHAYSVAVGNPDERSVPLLNLSDCVEYANKMVAAERERCAKLCDSKYEKHAANGFPREASTARALASAIRDAQRLT